MIEDSVKTRFLAVGLVLSMFAMLVVGERQAAARNVGTKPEAADVVCFGGTPNQRTNEICITDSGDIVPTTSDSKKLGTSALKFAQLNITAGGLTDSSINTADLATDSVDSTKIRNGTVDSQDLATSAVDTGKIAAGAVNSTKIVDLSLNTQKLAPDAVNTTKIAQDAVNTSKMLGLSSQSVPNGSALCAKGGAGVALGSIGYCTTTPTNGLCTCN